jgi:hypothetical protein
VLKTTIFYSFERTTTVNNVKERQPVTKGMVVPLAGTEIGSSIKISHTFDYVNVENNDNSEEGNEKGKFFARANGA